MKGQPPSWTRISLNMSSLLSLIWREKRSDKSPFYGGLGQFLAGLRQILTHLPRNTPFHQYGNVCRARPAPSVNMTVLMKGSP